MVSSVFSEVFYVRIDIRIDVSRQVHLEELTQMRLIKQAMVTSSRQDHVAN